MPMPSIVALRTFRALAVYRPAPAALFLAARPTGSIADVTCVGWDGGPLRLSGVERWQGKEEESREEEDVRKYYEKNKPSPLSELEFVDTRKPITRATAHGGDREEEHSVVRGSLDDALLLAEEIWRAAKVWGVPDYPHSRALARALAIAKRDLKTIAN